VTTPPPPSGPAVTAIDRVPGPRGLDAFLTVKRIGTHPFETLAADIRKYGDVVRYPMGLVVVYFIHHPDHVRQVLETNHTNYKRSRFYARMKPLLGEGLITSDGDLWRRQRRLIQKGFSRKLLQSFSRTVIAATRDMLDAWAPRAADGEAFDVCRPITGLSLAIAGQVMFHADVARDARIVEEALPVALDEIDARFNEIVTVPDWIPTPRNLRFRRCLRRLDEMVARIVQERRTAEARHGDILDILMGRGEPDTGPEAGPEGPRAPSGRRPEASDQPPAVMDDRQIRDEVMTLLLAGHETTANLLAWTLYLLGRHPDAQQAAAEDVARAWGDSGPSYDGLGQLRFVPKVLQESLRLYPPAWSMDREAIGEDVIGGYRIPAGSVVFLPPFFVHRHRDFWPDPERFDPGRFDEEAVAARHRYAFVPFGGGPRLCVGRDLAMMTAGIALGMILSRYRVSLDEGHPVEMHPAITLRPRHGVRVKLAERRPGSGAPGA
jgi:cytochrome P450